jgi:hypothetical protein
MKRPMLALIVCVFLPLLGCPPSNTPPPPVPISKTPPSEPTDPAPLSDGNVTLA